MPNRASVRFVSTYASARPEAWESGEARPGEAAGFGTPGSRPRPPGCLRRPAPTPHARCSFRPCRDFIEKRYVELKKANPDLPILIRECSDVQPKLWARYGEQRTPGT